MMTVMLTGDPQIGRGSPRVWLARGFRAGVLNQGKFTSWG